VRGLESALYSAAITIAARAKLGTQVQPPATTTPIGSNTLPGRGVTPARSATEPNPQFACGSLSTEGPPPAAPSADSPPILDYSRAFCDPSGVDIKGRRFPGVDRFADDPGLRSATHSGSVSDGRQSAVWLDST
jgi:hypothetical protein